MSRGSELSGQGSRGEITLRSAKSTYVVFTAIFGVLALPLAYLGITKDPSAWRGLALSGVALSCFFVHFGYLRVTVSQGLLTYRRLFGRRSLQLAAIARSRIEQHTGRDKRPFLVITPTDGQTVLRVNLKPFRREDIRALLALPELKLEGREHVA